MLYTLTLNPSLDYMMECSTLSLGETNRSTREYIRFGGKGLNVSAVLSSLSVPSVAVTLLGGKTGDMLKELLKEEGISAKIIPIESPTRINVKLLLDNTTEINARGPALKNDEIKELFTFFDELTAKDTLVLSGSIPASLSDEHFEKMLERLELSKTKLVLDATGDMLWRAAPYKPYLVKPNKDELSCALGMPLDTLSDIECAMRKLSERGAKNVLVSLGAEGAMLLSEDGQIYRQAAHKATARNTVGAGDTMLAAFLFAQHLPPCEALRLAVAAGSATVSAGRLAKKADIDAVLKKM